MRKKNIANQNFTINNLVALFENATIKHTKKVIVKTSAKYLKKVFSEEPTPSLQFVVEFKSDFWLCVAENNFLQTIIAYTNGAKYKGIKNYNELTQTERRVFNNSVVNVWFTYYLEKEANNE
jgi:hypothetical protein